MASPAEQKAVAEILRDCEVPVIFDLGSYDGGDAAWMAAACKKSPRLLLVEPDKRNINKMYKHEFRNVEDLYVLCGAVADRSGTCTFHVCDNDTQQAIASGSIHAPTGHLQYFPWCKFPTTTEVTCYSLDDLFLRYASGHIDMLWVDVQGAEADCIKGGADALKHTRYIFIEAEEVEFYEGQALRPELLEMLPSWDVVGTFDYNLLLKNREYAG